MNTIISGNRGGNKTHECTDCGRWSYEGEQIRHSSRCDYPAAQDASVARAKTGRGLYRAAKAGVLNTVATEEEIVAAVRRGEISVSDAMNQDT